MGPCWPILYLLVKHSDAGSPWGPHWLILHLQMKQSDVGGLWEPHWCGGMEVRLSQWPAGSSLVPPALTG